MNFQNLPNMKFSMLFLKEIKVRDLYSKKSAQPNLQYKSGLLKQQVFQIVLNPGKILNELVWVEF